MPGIRWAAVLVAVLGAGTAGTALWQYSVQAKLTPIERLASLPDQSAVHLAGVVVAGSEIPGQFWIRDATGAMPIGLDPAQAGVQAGERVAIEATKTGGPEASQEGAKDTLAVGNRAAGKAAGAVAARKAGVRGQKGATGPDVGRGAAAEGDRPLAITDAAAGVQLTGMTVERDWSREMVLGAVGAFLLAWLLVLHWWGVGQRSALKKAGESTHALRLLTTAVQRLTRDGTFDMEVPVQGDPEVAPLAIGVNAMLAELSQREKARRAAESRLENWALIDDLTGLPNRRLLSDRLSQSLTKAQRDATIVALLFVDLDGFKLVNDSLGHSGGDALLAEMARRMKTNFRQSDTLARIGGDEFALILDKIVSRDDAQSAAESLLELIKQPFEISGQTVRVSASIGMSIFPDGNERGQLLQQADCAMYAAKRNGKGRIVRFTDNLGSAARERLTLEGELQHAVAKGQISVVYQPEFDLETNAIVRFEALARWTHPAMGLIMPMSFIPVAEENGLIIPLGAYIMERACAEAVSWQEIASHPVQVAVNVSTVQFSRDSFFEEVADVLHRTGLHPSLLQIELTESATVAGVERAAEMMRRLKRMGVSVAVDDFGTGYSCLSYLPKLSFDAVKLDRSFVHELTERRETRSFIKSILELAHNLHMRVIAEGVETQEQLKLIKSLGTDEAQGYLLGRPSSDPAELVRDERRGEVARGEVRGRSATRPAPREQYDGTPALPS
ncbi:MAG TPA: EAL domain-containing protein [Acidobacteriaceae bacterium]|nr:EAL domain-containing protein [Acidobacteriaceae bacterium]